MTDMSKAAFAAKATYVAVLPFATVYVKLPNCNANPQPCSDNGVVATMQNLGNAADKATQGAEDAVRSLGQKPELVRVAVEGAAKSVEVFKQVVEAYKGVK
jgi:copper(I)-binding protein